MKRNVRLEDISDGRLYGENDMVKADCRGCEGCSQCCRGMGSSIILDPYDISRLERGAGIGMQELLAKGAVELNVVDGVILPNLAMTGAEEKCAFLDDKGRCSIHASRPGICRLFPLGRYYENGDFKYFLQVGECSAPHSKVKVNKWIDTPLVQSYHRFILQWHDILNNVENIVQESLFGTEEGKSKELNMLLLQKFYFTPYVNEDFYKEFETRYQEFVKIIS